jgi:hypothetical protein
MFDRAIATDEDRPWWQPVKQDAARMRDLVLSDQQRFRAEINRYVSRYRAALQLPDLLAPV